MNKILLTLLCLLTVSVFAGTTFAFDDDAILNNNDSIQISENTNNDIIYSQSNQANQKTTTPDDEINENTHNKNNLKRSEAGFLDTLFGKPFDKNPKKPLNNTITKKPLNTTGLKPNNPSKSNNTNSNSTLNITGPKSHNDNGPHFGPKLDIKGPKDPKNPKGPKGPKGPLDIKGQKGPKLDIKGPKGPKLDSKQIEFMKLCEIYKKYGKDNLTMELKNNSDGKQVIAFYTTSSGMSGATSTCVGEVGSELTEILEREGVFDKMAYGTVWCAAKIGELFFDGEMDESAIKFLATANLTPIISMMWDDFTDDVSDWWDDLWD